MAIKGGTSMFLGATTTLFGLGALAESITAVTVGGAAAAELAACFTPIGLVALGVTVAVLAIDAALEMDALDTFFEDVRTLIDTGDSGSEFLPPRRGFGRARSRLASAFGQLNWALRTKVEPELRGA